MGFECKVGAVKMKELQRLFKQIRTKMRPPVTSPLSETSTCLASGSSMLYWVPAGPSLTLSPRRKPRRVINVLAASSTDGGGPSSWLDSPAEAERGEEVEGRGEG